MPKVGRYMNVLRTAFSGRIMPLAMMPTLDLAMPYDAPKLVNTIEMATPMAPKKGYSGLEVLA